MVLQYELAFDGTNWWMPFIDRLVVPRLASQFVAISVVPPNERVQRVPHAHHRVEADRVAEVDDEEGLEALHGEMDRRDVPLDVQCATHKGGSCGLVLGVDVAPDAGSACHQQ